MIFSTKNEKETDYNTVVAILYQIQEVIDYDPNTLKTISKTTHFYTLFTLTYLIVSQNTSYTNEQKELLSQFYKKYLEGSEETEIDNYRNYSKDSTNSKQSRMARLKAVRNYLKI